MKFFNRSVIFNFKFKPRHAQYSYGPEFIKESETTQYLNSYWINLHNRLRLNWLYLVFFCLIFFNRATRDGGTKASTSTDRS